MKKKILALIIASAMVFSFSGCGSSPDEAADDKDTVQSDNDNEENTDITAITQSEISELSDNQFYAANSTGTAITDIYVALSGAGDWGANLISAPIENGTKVKITVNNIDPEASYDICVVDDKSNSTEYNGFNMKSTVQVTFYEDAQCDVSTV